jgi:alpha-glucoside transport system permease protein
VGGKIIDGVIAIAVGVGGALLLFFVLNWLVERLPEKWETRLKPYVFIGPALVAVGIFLLYPLLRTVFLSVFDARGEEFVGFENFSDLFGSEDFRDTLINNVLWLLIVPPVVVGIGLAVATLADRLAPRGERLTKSLIFVPMAISFVGAATIWRFVYESRPEGQPQIGILNAIGTKLGFEPVAFIQKSDLRVNTLLLMVVLIWLQVGFAMVLLSAAIKSVPGEVIEASRVDGATERQIFFRVLLPQIWPTVVTVLVITMILVLKVFDVVYVMTGGQFKTDVIGNRFVIELFQFGNEGRAAAIVVILLLAVVPAMIYQVRQFRAQEAG